MFVFAIFYVEKKVFINFQGVEYWYHEIMNINNEGFYPANNRVTCLSA